MARTAVVVDDIAFVRNMLKDILSTAKISVVAEGENGDEAVLLFRKHKPDLLFMDVVMPRKGGIEATRQILDRNKEARIIIVSAMAHELLLMEAINAGARDYILKPFTAADIIKAIERLFQAEEEEEQRLEGKATKGARKGV